MWKTVAGTVLSTLVLSLSVLQGQVSVLTHHGDRARTGANLNETTLTVAKVKSGNFGKLVYRTVDGNIYAQPLIVAEGTGGQTKNVAIVSTENNSVYAFNADDVNQNSTTAQLWKASLGPSIDSATLYSAIGKPTCSDLTLQIGITGTPVVQIAPNQPSQGVVFVAAKSKNGNRYSYTLYALNLADGSTLGSIPFEGSVPGQGYGSANGRIAFNPLYQLNRPALLLVGNVLYTAFGGHCDSGPYHGWVFAFDVSNPRALRQIAVICTTPNGKGPQFDGYDVEGMGGIWMSGAGPAADAAGNVYVVTGNGTYNGTTDFSDSVLKLKLNGSQLQLLDWFTPENQTLLKEYDYDLGSGGVAVVPNSHQLVAGGKEGRLFLLDANNLGKGTAQALQSFIATRPLPNPPLAYNVHGTPVFWPHGNETFVYVMGEESPLRQYTLTKDPGDQLWRFNLDPTAVKSSQESAPYPNFPTGLFDQNRTEHVWMPGGFLTLSANGTTDGTGILWAAMPFASNANPMVVRGVLRAFNASDVSTGELWDSEGTGNNSDRLGQFAKFCPPVVANEKVYVAAFQQETVLEDGRHIKTTNGDQPALVIYGMRN
jgi:hypothetical protein